LNVSVIITGYGRKYVEAIAENMENNRLWQAQLESLFAGSGCIYQLHSEK
jgi:hypothetical protein